MKHLYYTSSLLTLLACVIASLPAQAKSDDMFYDRNWVYDRPSVPSDKYKGQDVFTPVPTMGDGKGDAFSRLNKTNTYGRDDMLPQIPTNQPRPSYILKMDPDIGPYNAR